MKTQTRLLRPLLALAAGLAFAVPAAADPWFGESTPFWTNGSHSVADGNVVDVQVEVDGTATPLYFKPGTNDRHYFQAFRGRNYSLVVRNTTGRRVGVLIAVDGVNVVSGQRSALDRHEQMYVLDPWESAEIQGWRTSLDDVRRFVFVDEQRSYAARTGQANGDMGWIRVMAFREVERQVRWNDWDTPRIRDEERGSRSRLDGSPSPLAQEPAPAPSGREQLQKGAVPQESQRSLTSRDDSSAPGTGWGDHRYDPVQQTTFEPQAWAADQITLRYEYSSGLRALGIFPRRPRVYERDHGQLGFAPAPRW